MLSALVDDINAILEAKPQALQLKPVNLVDLVHTMLADLRMRIAAGGRRLDLEEEIPPELPPLSGDSVLLGRVLDNLLSNALKFTPDGGRIAIRLWQEGTEIVLQVADTGIGIPADQLEYIFERFYQVDGSAARRYGGSGLGLALVKEIVGAHGGRVTVESQVGQGSVFAVWLPLTGAQS
jgi:signal transduction histidine kinase